MKKFVLLSLILGSCLLLGCGCRNSRELHLSFFVPSEVRLTACKLDGRPVEMVERYEALLAIGRHTLECRYEGRDYKLEFVVIHTPATGADQYWSFYTNPLSVRRYA